MPVLIANQIETASGYPTSIGRMFLNPFRGTASIQNISVDYPEYAEHDNLLDVSECRLELELLEYFREDRIHIRDLFIHVESLTYLVGADSEHRSFDFLDKLKNSEAESEEDVDRANDTGQIPVPGIKIDHCSIQVDVIYLLDLSDRGEKTRLSNQVMKIELEDLNGVEDLIYSLIVEMMQLADSRAFKNLLNELEKKAGSEEDRIQSLKKLKQFFEEHVQDLPEEFKNLIEKFSK